MNNCANDFGPIIAAIAAVISVQVPLIVTYLLNIHKSKRDTKTIKKIIYANREKINELHFMTKNGFHGPPGPPGPPGPAIEVPVNTVEK